MFPRLAFYCGLMLSFFGYSYVVYTTGTHLEDTVEVSKADVFAGRRVFQENNCIACHQLYGLGGHMGPDLTNTVSNPQRGEAYARAVLKHGSAPMPNFNLTDKEIDALMAFLKHVDASGESPPRNFNITPWGSIEVMKKDDSAT